MYNIYNYARHHEWIKHRTFAHHEGEGTYDGSSFWDVIINYHHRPEVRFVGVKLLNFGTLALHLAKNGTCIRNTRLSVASEG